MTPKRPPRRQPRDLLMLPCFFMLAEARWKLRGCLLLLSPSRHHLEPPLGAPCGSPPLFSPGRPNLGAWHMRLPRRRARRELRPPRRAEQVAARIPRLPTPHLPPARSLFAPCATSCPVLTRTVSEGHGQARQSASPPFGELVLTLPGGPEAIAASSCGVSAPPSDVHQKHVPCYQWS